MHPFPSFLGLSVAFTLSLAGAAADARFGLVGTGGKAFAEKFGLSYYALEGNYPASGNVFSSVNPANDPAGGRKVLRKVAKLNVRNDSLGQTNAQFEAALGAYANALVTWNLTGRLTAKPVFTWYAPAAASLSAAESLQIITTIRREKALVPAVTGTVWEIGNEPNLFPALLPARYGEIFARYYKIIKGEDPAAKIAMGPVFVRELAADLLLRMREIQTQTLIQRGLGQPGQALFDSVDKDLWATYSSRVLNLGTVDYFAQALAAMDSSVKPDVVSLHVYPFDDRAPLLSAPQAKATLDSLADSLRARFQARGASPALWITEFGNINPAYDAEAAATQASALIDVFLAGTRYSNWFYYKATGADAQLAGVPGLGLPLTRLAADSAFSPADGNFACGRLNAIGRMYYLRANGVECAEKAGFTTAVSSYNPFDTGPTHFIPVAMGRSEVDTVRFTVAVKGGTLQQDVHYTLASSTLTFAPGDTLKSVTLQSSALNSGSIILVLRNPLNAGLTGDSVHTVNVSAVDLAILPGLPGSWFSLDRARAALVLQAPRDVDLSIRILDAAGKTQGLLRTRSPAGRSVIALRSAFRNGALPAGLYKIEVSGPGFRKTFSLPWMN